ncbi:MAG: Smr/MutS family protein, partial [Gloeomargarita sp. DG_2_bins_126]
IPGRSQALHIAQRLGLAPEIIQRAAAYLEGQPTDLNDLIRQMEQQRQEQTAQQQAATELLAQTEQLYQQLQQQAQELRRQKQALAQEQNQAVASAVAQAKQEIAQVIQTLKAQNKTHQASTALTEIQKRHQARPQRHPQGFVPQLGQRVRVLGQVGEVLSLPDADGKMAVRLGQLRVTTPAREITSLDGQPVALPPPPLVPTPANTIDLRGMRVEQVPATLNQRLHPGEPAWWIVHGQGTGRLRQAVRTYLEQHPHIHHWETPEPSTTIAYWRD